MVGIIRTLGGGNGSNMVDQRVGDAYWVVNEVYKNLAELKQISEGFNEFDVNAAAAIAAKDAAEADAIQTAADRVQTAADRVQTALDVITTTAQAVIATTQAGLATTNGEAQVDLAEAQAALATAQAVLTAADRVQTGLDVIATNADVVATALDVIATTSARDAALIQAGVYTTEALGRAAVADGQAFKVQGSGDVAAYEYRRTSSTVSVLIASYPSSAAVAALDGSYSLRTGLSQASMSLADGDGFEMFRLGLDGSLLTDTVDLSPTRLKTPALDLTATHLNTTAFSVQAASESGLTTGLALLDGDGFYSEVVGPSGGLSGIAPVAAAVTVTLSPLRQLRDALSNDLTDVMIRLIGDSITWGMTVTGGGTQDPRTHALTDPRNNLTSPTWANLLHKYMGNRRSIGALTNPLPGVALYTATHQIDVVRDPKVLLITATGEAATKSEYTNAGALLSSACDVASTQALTFQVVGDNITVVYAKLPSDATAGFEVFVDDVSQGIVSTYNASGSFGNSATYTLAQGAHGIKIKAVGASIARIEGLRFIRKIRVSNDGLIGTNTAEWLPTAALLPASIADDDTFVFCQLGTNDRALTTAPSDPARTKRNLAAIANYISVTRSKPLIMMAANFATPDYPASAGTYYGQSDVARMVSQLSFEKGYSFVDNYQATLKLSLAGTAFLADGLHPNDAGHLEMFKNIVTQIETA